MTSLPLVQQESILKRFGVNEVEFLSEDMSVSVIPSFKHERIKLISGEYGPFRPNMPTTVPLWLAKQLKKKQKCKIQTPEWMDVDSLAATYENEKEDTVVFEYMPYHYIEIASQLLAIASDDIREPHRVRELIENIWEVRHIKIMAGMRSLDGESPGVKLNNLGAMEINAIRPFFLHTMRAFRNMTPPTPDLLSQTQSQTPGTATTPTTTTTTTTATTSTSVVRRATAGTAGRGTTNPAAAHPAGPPGSTARRVLRRRTDRPAHHQAAPPPAPAPPRKLRRLRRTTDVAARGPAPQSDDDDDGGDESSSMQI